jgi:hypothetical protein
VASEQWGTAWAERGPTSRKSYSESRAAFAYGARNTGEPSRDVPRPQRGFALWWASAVGGAWPIADEENSQRPTFFLSMGGNLYFTCAAQHSVGVSCL